MPGRATCSGYKQNICQAALVASAVPHRSVSLHVCTCKLCPPSRHVLCCNKTMGRIQQELCCGTAGSHTTTREKGAKRHNNNYYVSKHSCTMGLRRCHVASMACACLWGEAATFGKLGRSSRSPRTATRQNNIGLFLSCTENTHTGRKETNKRRWHACKHCHQAIAELGGHVLSACEQFCGGRHALLNKWPHCHCRCCCCCRWRWRYRAPTRPSNPRL
jgi:hypothetical protein